jgi:oligoribonuclease NrnB/cAMP/cGMP phosphodiesterase (DHH superfamily)
MLIPTMCLYHGTGCPDGFTAAWAVKKQIGDGCQYIPVNYQSDPPDVTGQNVVIVDFSYKREVMEELHEKANSLTVLDHHASAERELAPLLESGIIDGEFNMNYSGARLAWNAFHKAPPPRIVRYVEDYDLWKKVLSNTHEVTAYIHSFEQTWENWDYIAKELENDSNFALAVNQGVALRREKERLLKQFVGTARKVTVLGYDNVPVVNCNKPFTSEVGHLLLEAFPEAPFSATYCDFPEGRAVSLRSRKDANDVAEFDVSKLAETQGGGGHPSAAGYRVPADENKWR